MFRSFDRDVILKKGGKGELDVAEEKSRKKKIHYLDILIEM